jgi:hypothetical protein
MTDDGARARAILFLILAAFGLAFVGIGASQALEQRRALAHAHPVAATVVGLDVEEHHRNGNSGVTYRPVVHFEYQVDGTTRMGDQVGPMGEAKGGHWAWRVLDRYQAGQHVVAWVRDDMADKAYLEHTASPTPYYMLAFGVGFTTFMMALWGRTRP